ncbi:MAG: AAA family ATPase [Immundisolibacteraceae bacterium]|nr:AAA family ATPase [Immundisolibacteraceae bacterium]
MSTIEKAAKKLIGDPRSPSTIQANAPPLAPPGNVTQQSSTADSVTNQPNALLKLDKAKMRSLALLLPDMGNTGLAEQYRKLKHPLLRKIDASKKTSLPANIIMVTSALEGEGKSYTATNLALSIAMELDHTALLIDVDSIKNTVSSLVGITTDLGLTNYLGSNEVGVKDIIYSTDIPKLKIIPAGDSELFSTESATSTKMKQFLAELSSRYSDRVIILDTPPIMLSAIAKVLAYMVGQIVMVVEAEKTPISVIEEATDHLDTERFSGFILNKTNLAGSTESLYGSYG